MTLPLTEQQEKLWRFIRSCQRSPSFEEMAAALGSNSKGRMHDIIRALEAKGFIRRIPCRARSIIAIDPRNDGVVMVPFRGRIS